jgi:hypothetical protein
LAKTFSSVTGEMTPYTSSYGSNVNNDLNFGQKPFKYAPPDGFQPLNAANVKPETVIVRPDQFVGITTWKGNGATGLRTINADFKFKPDFVWEKVRTGTDSHILYDSVRGYGASKALKSNSNVAEGENDNSTYGYVNSVFNGGIEIYGGSSAASDSFTNENNQDMVAWSWKAGGNSNTFNVDDVGYATASAAGLTAGTITPSGASVNTKSGFSIIKYSHTINSPQAIAHGLTKAPEFIIAKFLDGTANWNVYHASGSGAGGGPQTGRLILNSTNAYSDEVDVWNDTAPTNQVWTVGGSTWQGSGNHITYLWHSVPGFSKFGSYTHNNSADGPFIELGFKPALILIKKYNVTGRSWVFIDSERDKFNVAKYNLWPNLTNGDATTYDVLDILSNGFKVRTNTNGWVGESTDQYIYAAWAEAPTFNLYGGQSNAR